jgi:lambda family phage portal protein
LNWERTAECIGRDGQALWEIQHEMQRDWESRGEWFVLIGDEYDPFAPTTLKVEVIEPDRVSTPPGKEGDVNVRMGVQLKDGRAIGYWVRDSHPVDTLEIKESWTYYPKKLKNGQFRMFHHYARVKRGQHRGFPRMQVGTKRLKNAEEYASAELERNNIGACMAAFVRSDSEIFAEMEAAGVVTDADGKKQRDIVPGMIQYLGPADEVSFSNPQGAPTSFVPFMEYEARQFAAGCGTAYEMLTGDWKNLSYSTGRVLFNIEDATVDVLQMGHAKTLMAIYRNFITRAVTGVAPILDIDQSAYRSAPWLYWSARIIPPASMSIDPPREDRNDLTMIEAGVKPHSDFVERKNGQPADKVYARIQRNREEMEELGINTTMPQMGRDKPSSGAPTQRGDGNQESSDANSKRQETGAAA